MEEELNVFKGMHKSLVDNREADRQKRETEAQESGKDETNKDAENSEEGFDMNTQVLDEMERVYMLEINNKIGEIGIIIILNYFYLLFINNAS